MGKKKAPVFRDASAKNKSNQDEGASIKAIRTWDDIEHDSEDECRWISTSLPNDRSLFIDQPFYTLYTVHDRRGKVLLDEDADNGMHKVQQQQHQIDNWYDI